MISAANFADLDGLVHGFGERSSTYPEGITTAKQIHSAIVQNARSVMGKNGSGEADALISKDSGVIVGIRTADCVPILLADPLTGAVAAIHAGWRGTAEGIAAGAVRSLMAEWQIDPRNLRAAIGPSIGSCCYEVGPEVAQRFGIRVSRPVHLDLPGINEMQLRATGVSNIWKSGACTFCAMTGAPGEGYRFHSFRREREAAGRMVSYIGWQKHIGRTQQGPPENQPDVQ
jgi:purine-nucleoside/S-methyl-5'-thioadenosine phosphorylase / adenosine deaminase